MVSIRRPLPCQTMEGEPRPQRAAVAQWARDCKGLWGKSDLWKPNGGAPRGAGCWRGAGPLRDA